MVKNCPIDHSNMVVEHWHCFYCVQNTELHTFWWKNYQNIFIRSQDILKSVFWGFGDVFFYFRGRKNVKCNQDLIIHVTNLYDTPKWSPGCWSNTYGPKIYLPTTISSDNKVICPKAGCAESEIHLSAHIF